MVTHPNFNEVQITVDDGGKGNHEYMLSIFEEFGIKAIFFIPTKFIAKKNNHASSYMNKKQIRELSDAGHGIGSHSHSHPKNIGLMIASAIDKELLQSKIILEDIIGKPITSFSVPGGFYNLKVLKCCINNGFTEVFNSFPDFKVRKSQDTKIFGRFSVEKEIRDKQLLNILNKDRTYGLMLSGRHFLSKSLHSSLHFILRRQ